MITHVRLLVMRGVICSTLWLAGCTMFDAGNSAARPWNRPTKAEISQDWLWRDGWDSFDYP